MKPANGSAPPSDSSLNKRPRPDWRDVPPLVLPAAALLALIAEIVMRIRGTPLPGGVSIGMLGLVLTGAPLVLRTLFGILHGRYAADIVASLAIITAVLLREPIPGLVVVIMQSGGEALERYAEGKASRAVEELERAAPRLAHLSTNGIVQAVPVESIVEGNLLLVRPGEMIPCDAVVVDGTSHIDTASLTGEPVPRRVAAGSPLMSGSLNQESPLMIRATAPASESQYARIVDLVRNAQESKAPIQRLADKYAIWFTPLTLLIAGIAYAASGDSLRILAVLVIATPCPLILATPVAVIGGINRAARLRIIFRHGTALEQVGRTDVVVFDKTGTLTIGRPLVSAVIPAPSVSREQLLAYAAAIEHGSSHLLARSLTDAVLQEDIPIPDACDVVEEPGRGLRGLVDGSTVVIGSRVYVEAVSPGSAEVFAAITPPDSGLRAYVSIDGEAAGIIEYADRVRPEAARMLSSLQALGINRTILLSGDSSANAEELAHSLGIAEARGDLLAEDKVTAVRGEVDAGKTVLMLGDGTNDAPALGTATVGMALASAGGGVTAEAADIVLLADDLMLLPAALRISRRTVRIAKQSILIGLGLSATGMVFAAFGYIAPIIGAVIQEGIDIGVILNALRASTGRTIETGASSNAPSATSV